MKTLELFQTTARGFNGFINAPIAKIIDYNPNGLCLWVQDECYMEVDCPDRYHMVARYETDKEIRTKCFPYDYKSFEAACEWFDKQRGI